MVRISLTELSGTVLFVLNCDELEVWENFTGDVRQAAKTFCRRRRRRRRQSNILMPHSVVI